ncbi:SRPBCC family protein [Microbacterium hydrocarbonoxydans]|uniref:Polyketide cyclase / dehydrase and lipid transport n=1 Tax=Microbacterium hydrocarbonoxydans TaxID=273678 RepID=A0A1H4JLA3_9MICO|nr:SRPBCC family protein [Microbacterium hydrocarbonoxydans]SEB47101.1 Polyketide cyclase / dehydrase and lipid transport [Microbacterium hydrocarbonoxydans]
MAKNVRTMDCRPDDVFRVLSNAWLYPAWVVGASRMRDVDATWPQPGAELHHSVGVWPFLLDDTTVVEEWSPPNRMVMRARGWPIGEARVTLRVRSYGGGTMVRIDEEPVSGPATLVPSLVTTPMLRWRNSETLHRLAYLAEGGAV